MNQIKISSVLIASFVLAVFALLFSLFFFYGCVLAPDEKEDIFTADNVGDDSAILPSDSINGGFFGDGKSGGYPEQVHLEEVTKPSLTELIEDLITTSEMIVRAFSAYDGEDEEETDAIVQKHERRLPELYELLARVETADENDADTLNVIYNDLLIAVGQ